MIIMRKVNSSYQQTLLRQDFARPEVDRHYVPPLDFEPKHQIIDLKFNIPQQNATGFIETTLIAKVSDAQMIKYDAENLQITRVEGPDSWNYDGSKLTCFWKTAVPKGEKRSTKVYYSVDHPISGLYFSNPDDEYPDRPRYAVTDVESIRARYWIPCIDHLSVRCSIDFHLTSKQDHIILANGELVSETKHADGTKTVHWHQAFPCPSYLITLAVGEFIEFEDRDADGGKGPIPVRYYTSKNFSKEDLGASFAGTPEFIEWMYKKFDCPLEWPKYYQIATSHHGGAMENISLVTWGDFAIMDARERKEFKWLVDWINVHELSHSWFGDMVVCNEFAHAWLKESWATYVEKLWYEDIFGMDAYLYGVYEDQLSYMSESDDKYARPIVTNHYESSWDMYDNHLYPGGAMRLHMLRKILGDAVFFPAVSDYLNTFKGKTVETIDFQRKLEDHSGINLQAFFEQWLYSAGYPKLEASFSYDEKTQLAKISLTQTQVDEKHKIGLFNFPLVVEWEVEENQFDRQKYHISEKKHTLYFHCTKKPLQVRLDPDFESLFSLDFNPGVDLLSRQLAKSNIIGKIYAARELAKTNSSANLNKIGDQYKEESFWGVKVEFLKALLTASNFHGVNRALDIIATEEDPKVLFHVIPKLQGKQHPKVLEGMENFITRENFYYYSLGEALKVIGSQRNKHALEILMNFDNSQDYRGIIEGFYLNAMGELRNPESIQFLSDKLAYGKVSDFARVNLLNAIVNTLKWASNSQKEQMIEKLEAEMHRDFQEGVIIRFIFAISQIDHPSISSLIAQFKSRVSTQFHPRLAKLMEKASKAKTPEDATKKFETQVKKLTEQVEKIQDRLDAIEASQKQPSTDA